jgi:SAM-dependent methyltransferase
MHTIAGRNIPKQIPLHHTYDIYKTSNMAKYHEKFNVITAMHVFDWIEDVEETIRNLSGFLKKNGLFLFAVFPKKHIIDSLKIKDLFEDFDSKENPTVGYANFDGIRIPTFVREASYYDQLFEKKGYEKVIEYYPPYPKEFLMKYNWKASLYPEMMILAYRKL